MLTEASQRRWLISLGLLYLALASGYSLLLPQWEGMDEPAHYLLALNLARVGVFSSRENNYEAIQPQAYYRLASVPLRWLFLRDPQAVAYLRPDPSYRNATHPIPIFPWTDQNFQWVPGLYLLRGLNILLGLGVLGLNFAALRRLAGPDQEIALAALGLAALTPQFLHTAATVNNDGLGNLAGAFLFWLLSLLHTHGLRPMEMALAALAALLLPFATKLTLLPISAAFLLALILRVRSRYPERLLRFGALAIAGLLALGLLFPDLADLLWRNITLRFVSVLDQSGQPGYIWRMARQVAWSYWGKAGWLAVGLPGWAVVALTGLAFTGAGRQLLALLIKDPRLGGETAAYRDVWLVAGLSLAAVARNALSTLFSQGRFLFPAIGAVSLLVIRGWHFWIPPAGRPWVLPMVVAIMLLANLLLWIGGLLPVYYQPFDVWFQ